LGDEGDFLAMADIQCVICARRSTDGEKMLAIGGWLNERHVASVALHYSCIAAVAGAAAQTDALWADTLVSTLEAEADRRLTPFDPD
jgi:hypothetical protein